jgi:hypothetical protein
MEVIFPLFVVLWLMQWNDKACIYWPKNTLHSGVDSTVMHAQCTVMENIILDSGAYKGTLNVVVSKPGL